ncbi:subclass B3 metallo-beta-lactamase [Luteitalea sp.]|jgi:metallo-beta-lactamase class B|uniref:subclass B3 metallo-beta-lactamase n=1 Tax=Luteitalea sp. TaxID=2004800 RepID=UPI0037CB9145
MPSVRVLSALVSCLVLALGVVGTPAQDDPDGWKRATEPVRIAGPIHYVGTHGLASYLIATPAGHILIDGGVPGHEGLILQSIVKQGFKVRDVKVLLTTQAHFDHVGSLAALKQATGARVLVLRGDEGLLSSGGKTDYLFGPNPAFHFPPVTPDEVIGDGHVLTLGGVMLTARRTPGHTPGSTTWTTTVMEEGRSLRVVFAASTYVNEGTRLVRNPSYPGIEADFRRSFALLEALPVDVFLGAHAQGFDFHAKRARAATEGVKPWVDRDALKRVVTGSKATFEKLVAAER